MDNEKWNAFLDAYSREKMKEEALVMMVESLIDQVAEGSKEPDQVEQLKKELREVIDG